MTEPTSLENDLSPMEVLISRGDGDFAFQIIPYLSLADITSWCLTSRTFKIMMDRYLGYLNLRLKKNAYGRYENYVTTFKWLHMTSQDMMRQVEKIEPILNGFTADEQTRLNFALNLKENQLRLKAIPAHLSAYPLSDEPFHQLKTDTFILNKALLNTWLTLCIHMGINVLEENPTDQEAQQNLEKLNRIMACFSTKFALNENHFEITATLVSHFFYIYKDASEHVVIHFAAFLNMIDALLSGSLKLPRSQINLIGKLDDKCLLFYRAFHSFLLHRPNQNNYLISEAHFELLTSAYSELVSTYLEQSSNHTTFLALKAAELKRFQRPLLLLAHYTKGKTDEISLLFTTNDIDFDLNSLIKSNVIRATLRQWKKDTAQENAAFNVETELASSFYQKWICPAFCEDPVEDKILSLVDLISLSDMAWENFRQFDGLLLSLKQHLQDTFALNQVDDFHELDTPTLVKKLILKMADYPDDLKQLDGLEKREDKRVFRIARNTFFTRISEQYLRQTQDNNEAIFLRSLLGHEETAVVESAIPITSKVVLLQAPHAESDIAARVAREDRLTHSTQDVYQMLRYDA